MCGLLTEISLQDPPVDVGPRVVCDGGGGVGQVRALTTFSLVEFLGDGGFPLFWQSRLAAWMGIDGFFPEILPRNSSLYSLLLGGRTGMGLDWVDWIGLDWQGRRSLLLGWLAGWASQCNCMMRGKAFTFMRNGFIGLGRGVVAVDNKE